MKIVEGEYLFSSLLSDVIGIIRTRVIDSQVRFVVNLDCNIPDRLFGDKLSVRRILLNVLSNAVKFTDEGFVSLVATGAIDGDSVVLTMEVADSGRGMKPEDVAGLFGGFARGDAAAGKGVEGVGKGVEGAGKGVEGAGKGVEQAGAALAIVHSLVGAMGGSIEVSSELGVGSTFTITLPQKILSHEKIASVQNPEEKRVLVYEMREIYADSIICSIDNLGVACTLVSTDTELLEEMSCGDYGFVIIESDLYENVREQCRAALKGATVAVLAGYGEAVADMNVRVIAMPVHSIFVANLLNGVLDDLTYAEGGTEKETPPQIAGQFQIDGMDTDKGIKMLGGKLETYVRILGLFTRDGYEKIGELRECIETENVRLYATYVHALKGAAANIGADGLSEMAKTLETAGKGGDLAFVRANNQKLMTMLEILLGNIEAAIAEYKGDGGRVYGKD